MATMFTDPQSQFGPRLPRRFLHEESLREEVIGKLRKAAPLAAARIELPSFPTMHLTRVPLSRKSIFPAVRIPVGIAGPNTLSIIRDFNPEQLDQSDSPGLESIVKDLARPSFLVQDDSTNFTQRSELPVEEVIYWRQRIEPHAEVLKSIYQSVGRIELHNHETLDWCGTGWLLRLDVLATNRHVAQKFAESAGGKWTFLRNIMGYPISADIDYAEEADNPQEDQHRITDILYIQEHGPDMAFLRVVLDKPRGPQNAGIPLAPATAIQIGREVLTIGYARYDSAMPEPPDMVTRVFGHEFNVKRAAPGVIISTQLPHSFVTHDCSTLGGNSGSVVYDLESGLALGLHMGGNFLSENYAVSADFLTKQLRELNLA